MYEWASQLCIMYVCGCFTSFFLLFFCVLLFALSDIISLLLGNKLQKNFAITHFPLNSSLFRYHCKSLEFVFCDLLYSPYFCFFFFEMWASDFGAAHQFICYRKWNCVAFVSNGVFWMSQNKYVWKDNKFKQEATNEEVM